ncbi:NAD-dependent malic enzyme [Acetobacter estunensis]|uniref:Oxaloacetate-decarboxylating malate dehydrogenase n=1 Tax=Acetobacter estunensis TaxID=104097 RepID=A0A967B4W7_9PROT|nr:NAD-dependent malic enzyme [Acetobacter estunensis]MBV1838684.1 NAD-dependent malic enzyme [Acetobacter estunensis]NHO53817.1 oxaloacetate-decarboxylating malate dehydrogenase [Acetobacter estunensis]
MTSSKTSLRGMALLNDGESNHGTGFTQDQRRELGLEGLLPPQVETLDRQVERSLRHVEVKPDDLERYIYLNSLVDQNETLFYKVLRSDPARFVPIIYAPTLARACKLFSHIYRRPRGMYITLEMRGRIKEVLRNWPVADVRTICVTTGGRILGLGDIGVNGMGIPIGKLQLYTVCGSVPPRSLLPIQLDIGTTNAALRADPLYLGLRREPPPLAELDEFVEEFVDAVQDVFPGCCLHFEDWKGTDALRYLAKYRDRVLSYNDDIQGTGAVTLAGLFTAMKIKEEKLSDQRYLFLGAGSSGLGTADILVSAMKLEGLSEEEACERITLMDVDGLLESSRTDLLPEHKRFAHPAKPTKDLLATIQRVRPTVLLGVSTCGGAFNETIIREMAKLNEKPIIFSLSLPQTNAECTAEQAYQWSDGRALFAGGIQFPNVEMDGRTFYPGQANNFYIFPGLALAVYATRPKLITDELIIETARALADQVNVVTRERGRLFPPQSEIIDVSMTSAIRLADFIFEKGMAQVERPADIRAWIEGLAYDPKY